MYFNEALHVCPEWTIRRANCYKQGRPVRSHVLSSDAYLCIYLQCGSYTAATAATNRTTFQSYCDWSKSHVSTLLLPLVFVGRYKKQGDFQKINVKSQPHKLRPISSTAAQPPISFRHGLRLTKSQVGSASVPGSVDAGYIRKSVTYSACHNVWNLFLVLKYKRTDRTGKSTRKRLDTTK